MADGTDTSTPQDFNPDPSMNRGVPYVADPSLQQMAASILASQNDPPPAGVDAPVQMPSQLPNLPAPTSPDVHKHMSWIGNVLDRVGTILGGDETMHIKKDTDGNVTITKDPSTTGEKWGRVAAAALGGAATGIANSQGPEGGLRATAAGTQFGLQQPQQRRQEVQQEATADQQTMLRNGQKALVQQQIAQNAFRMKQLGVALTQEQSDRANENEKFVTDNGGKKIGDFNSMDDVIKYENTHGDLIKNHAGGMFHTEVLPEGGVRLFTVDQAWLDQRNDKPVTYKRLEAGDTADAPMKLVDHTIPARGMTNRDILMAQENQTQRISKYQLDLAGLEEKTEAAKQAAADRAEARADRRSFQEESIAQRRQSQSDSLALRREIAEGKGQISGEAQPPAPAGSYDANFPPLQNFPANTEGIIRKNIGKPTADVAKAARLGRSAIQNSQDAINILQQHPDLVGRLNSLGSRWQQAVGVSNNDPLTALQGFIEQSTQASLGAHNYRGTKYAQQKEEEITNHLKNDPSSIIAQLQARVKSNQQFVNEERNYNLYGTPTGPDRGYDVSRQQTKTLPQAKDYSKVVSDGKGSYKEWDGKNWTDVAPPPPAR